MDSHALTQEVKRIARAAGANLVGIAPVERFRHAPAKLGPTDHLPGASHVIVVGRHLPDASIERWGKPPAESIYSYRSYGHGPVNLRLVFIVQDVTQFLEEQGYPAYPVSPLGSQARLMPDGRRSLLADFSNRHAAVAAGLGEFGWLSIVLTPEYGPRQRFASVIAEAPLEADPMYDSPPLCAECMAKHPVHPCAAACPVDAISREETDRPCPIGERTFNYARVDHWRCHWCEVEGLVKEGGAMYSGYTTDVPPPPVVTPEAVLEALEKRDPWHAKSAHSFEVLGPWCGRCLHACTYGKLTYRRRLSRARKSISP